uniref:Acyltransferase n=1 Tax=Callorhinchus milii TaxID=7868 RepID=A0A4W3JPA9_CALMI
SLPPSLLSYLSLSLSIILLSFLLSRSVFLTFLISLPALSLSFTLLIIISNARMMIIIVLSLCATGLLQLVKTHNLLPSRNYIFGYHPHGIFCFGAFCNFGTEATGFSTKFPGIRPSLATLAGNFRMPILREYLMSGGESNIAKRSRANGSGNAVVIVIGGAAESLECSPGNHVVNLKHRKGFVRIALQNGADLVPVYSFGENEVYKQIIFSEDGLLRAVQRKFQKLIGFAPCLFRGRGFFSDDSWGLVPYGKPINTVVGEPITVPKIENPSQEEVDIYHGMYIQSLIKLFDRYKTKFGYADTECLAVM